MRFLTKIAADAAQKRAERDGLMDEILHGRNDDPSSLWSILPFGATGLGPVRGREKGEPFLGAARGFLGSSAGAVGGGIAGALPGALLRNPLLAQVGASAGGYGGHVLGTHLATRGYADDDE